MNTLKYIILSMVLAVLLAGCDGHLNLKPSDSVEDKDAFKTIEDLELGILGVYASIGNHSVVAMSSRASDDLRLSAQNRGQGVQIHNWTYTANSDGIIDIFNDMYHSINRANRLLAATEKFDSENETVQQITGEALFVRAYCHFELVRAYCKAYDEKDEKGIPYMREAVISYPERETQGAVYTKLLEDINEAYGLLEDNNADFSRATGLAALALKTKIQLYMNDWDGVIATATSVIDNEEGKRLAEMDEVEKYWKDGAGGEVESLFYLRRTINDARLGSLFADTNGDIFFQPAYDLMNRFETGDARFTAYFALNAANEIVVNKHAGREDDATNLVHYKGLRMADVYLMRAEAYAEKSMIEEAAADLNTLRSKRIDGAIDLEFTSPGNALLAVRLERRRELAYEGNRFYDLKRWGLGINRIPEDSEIASNSTLEAGNFRFVFPIPQAEMFANKNMVQNDGYSND